MPEEKFLSDERVAELWAEIKNYIADNTATIDGGMKIKLDNSFNAPPYTLKFLPDDTE